MLNGLQWGTKTEIASSLAPALSLNQNQWLLGAVLYNKREHPECPMGAAAGLRSKVRSWEHTLTFGHESVIRFLIDLEAWHLLEGVCLQRWATSRGPQWQRALCNALLGRRRSAGALPRPRQNPPRGTPGGQGRPVYPGRGNPSGGREDDSHAEGQGGCHGPSWVGRETERYRSATT